ELDTEVIVGVEALVRWQHPQRGLVPPGDFIPLAERTGLIVPLEIFVLTEATQQTASWRAAGSGCMPLTVAVNISARHLDDSDIVAHVAAALAVSGLEPAHLCVEITETAMIRDFSSALERVVGLRSLGVQIALDDFGTGLSSLAYLQKLPIDIVKIDRSFVIEVDTDARSEAVIYGIAMLAQAMGSSLVAEGIETRGQLDALRAIGCRRGQGFLVGRPVPAAELAARIPITQT
ncbi:MAG TPA: EAL domain-containing protein, partial [Cellulomonadaceae bacterium]|nr:EAL domain-containing protein [Cellulomonadaceae bacterium]